jgi:aspartate racemase
MTNKVLGVLGGMGPLASAHFMLRLTLLTPAAQDQDHIPTVLWSDPRVPDRTAAWLGAGPNPLPWLMRGISGLKAAGCSAIAIPCNTAHAWFQPMAREAGVPVLHIVDAAVADLRRIDVPRGASPGRISRGKIGLMGTAGTLAMRLYQDRLDADGWDTIEPGPGQMEHLVAPAIELVKANRVAEAYQPLADMVNSLAARGAAAVVLGCTEIPLALLAGPADTLQVPTVDTIDALARAAIAWARGSPEKLKNG